MSSIVHGLHGSRLARHLLAWSVGVIALTYVTYWYAGASAGAFDASALVSGDIAWILVSSALVMLMTPAVGFFYGGMVPAKNVVSVIKQSLLILSLVSVQWVLIGYSLAFGPGNGLIGGLSHVGLAGVGFAPDAAYAGTIPALLFMMFQGMFAIVTPALIIGAFVGRIRFATLVVFTLAWTTLVYDPIAHWVWAPDGWLRGLGALDFAGGTVVHMAAGFSALAAALCVGKRHESNNPMLTANNVPFVMLGAALLWFGWFGFNAGSALGSTVLAVNAFVVTNTAAAAAALVWVALSWAEHGKPSAMAAAIGAVCGLVTITPASGFVGPMASLVIGMCGGLVTYTAVYIRSNHIAIDDTLDAWAAHGVGGMVGALLTGVFAETAINSAGAQGALFGNMHLLLVQTVAVCVVAVYSFVATWVLVKVIARMMPLRVTREAEHEGLDLAAHGEVGYRL